jgi:hypothetical protein
LGWAYSSVASVSLCRWAPLPGRPHQSVPTFFVLYRAPPTCASQSRDVRYAPQTPTPLCSTLVGPPSPFFPSLNPISRMLGSLVRPPAPRLCPRFLLTATPLSASPHRSQAKCPVGRLVSAITFFFFQHYRRYLPLSLCLLTCTCSRFSLASRSSRGEGTRLIRRSAVMMPLKLPSSPALMASPLH